MTPTSQITTSELKNGTLVLPASIWQAWKDKKEVVIISENERLVVQPIDAAWDQYAEKMRRGSGKISARIISEAVRFAKRSAK